MNSQTTRNQERICAFAKTLVCETQFCVDFKFSQIVTGLERINEAFRSLHFLTFAMSSFKVLTKPSLISFKSSYLPSKRFENHKPQHNGRDYITYHNQSRHIGLLEQCRNFIRAGRCFSGQLLISHSVRQPHQASQLFIACLIEHGHIDKDE